MKYKYVLFGLKSNRSKDISILQNLGVISMPKVFTDNHYLRSSIYEIKVSENANKLDLAMFIDENPELTGIEEKDLNFYKSMDDDRLKDKNGRIITKN